MWRNTGIIQVHNHLASHIVCVLEKEVHTFQGIKEQLLELSLGFSHSSIYGRICRCGNIREIAITLTVLILSGAQILLTLSRRFYLFVC